MFTFTHSFYNGGRKVLRNLYGNFGTVYIFCKKNIKLLVINLWKANCKTKFLTCHIKFCTHKDSTSKLILVFVGMCQCNCTPFIDRLQDFPSGGKEQGVGLWGRVFHSGGGHGDIRPSYNFFSTLPHQFFFLTNPPMGHPPHLIWSPPSEKQHPPLKSESSFQKMIPKKTLKNWKTVINTCASNKNSTGKRWQKFHKNMIFSLGPFKLL